MLSLFLLSLLEDGRRDLAAKVKESRSRLRLLLGSIGSYVHYRA